MPTLPPCRERHESAAFVDAGQCFVDEHLSLVELAAQVRDLGKHVRAFGLVQQAGGERRVSRLTSVT
ncbi:MAG TPA: hypothetical protein VKG80_13520 [Trebonia sp.]|nr:hypothetical protein [Trebonia sp.]